MKKPLIGILTKEKNGLDEIYLDFNRGFIEFTYDLDAVVFLFSPENIGWKRHMVKAAFLDAGRWIEREVAFPDVIYDKGYGTDENLVEARRRFERAGIPFINPPSFFPFVDNKLLSYDLFAGYGVSQPLTVPFKERETLDEMLEDFSKIPYQGPGTQGGVIIKPVYGGEGVGVILVYQATDPSECVVVDNGDVETLTRSELVDRVLVSYYSGLEYDEFLAQQKLELPRINGSISDVRILFQKDGDGNPVVTEAYARIAKPGNVTTNLYTEGKDKPLLAYLNLMVSSSAETIPIRGSILHEARKVLDALSSKSTWGEVGVDIGLQTTEGFTPYVIEANGKPDFALEGPNQTTAENDIRKFRRAIEYAIYLHAQSEG